ncbi:hypothetical protein ACLKOZ_19730 [Arthrobacter sp. R4]|uniref:hypothetical protein n=1 Tax=Arthrobacter sp. R4 TaxID=644417 RepID=UPI003EDA87A0
MDRSRADEPTAKQGLAVPETGWASARRHPQVDQGWVGLPPEDEDPVFGLPAESWRYVIGQLRRWDQVDGRVNPLDNEDKEPRFLTLDGMLENRMG